MSVGQGRVIEHVCQSRLAEHGEAPAPLPPLCVTESLSKVAQASMLRWKKERATDEKLKRKEGSKLPIHRQDWVADPPPFTREKKVKTNQGQSPEI